MCWLYDRESHKQRILLMSVARKSVREMSKGEMAGIIARLLRDKDELVEALRNENECHREAQLLLKETLAVLDVFREQACKPKPKPKAKPVLKAPVEINDKESLQKAAKKLGVKIVMVEGPLGEKYRW